MKRTASLATRKLEESQSRFARSAQVTEDVFRQLTKLSRRAQLPKERKRFLKLVVSKLAKERNHALVWQKNRVDMNGHSKHVLVY